MENKDKIDICKDVIKQINARKLKIRTGSYICSDDDVKITGEAEIVVPFIQQHCSVCARGALMLRKLVLFKDECEIDTAGVEQEDTTEELSDFFDEEELDLIEAAFEGRDCSQRFNSYTFSYEPKINKQDLEAAFVFYKDHKDPANRLIAIMQNIIDHGRFIPQVRYKVY